MGEGLKRARDAARRTYKCPAKGCRRVKVKGGDICAVHQKQWDDAWRTLMAPKKAREV